MAGLSNRSLFVVFISQLVIFSTCLSARVFRTERAQRLDGPPEVTISDGLLRGETEESDGVSVDVFRGVPYAAPPVGE